MKDFLCRLFPKTLLRGCVTLWTFPDKASYHVPLDMLPDLQDRDLVQLQEDRQQNIFFGSALRREGLSERQQGGKSDVIAATALAIDIDFYDPDAHSSQRLPKTDAEAYSIISDLPDPSAFVHSGHGWHVWWMLDKPVFFNNDAQREAFEVAATAFQKQAIDKGQKLGFDVDKTSTIQRVWRVPGLNNLKVPESPTPVTLLGLDDVSYRLEDLVGTALPDLTDRAVQVPVTKTVPSMPALSSDPKDVQLVRDQLARLPKDYRNKQAVDQILEGKPFAKPGDRDNTLQSVCSTIVFVSPAARTVTPDALAEILRPSMETWDDEDWVAKAQSKFRRAQEDHHRKRLEEVGRYAGMEKALRRSAEEGNGSPDDVARSFEKRAIIQYKRSFYVYDFRRERYSHMLHPSEVLPYARKAWGDSPLEIQYENAKQQMVEKKIDHLLRDYSTLADKAEGRLSLDLSWFDTEKEHFKEAVCPLRDLEPRYDAEIDKWLTLLTEDDPAKLKSWLACLTRLDDPICALYLHGKSGAGKTLLANGAARLWVERGPADLAVVIGDYNDDMFTCPLVLCDEGLPIKKGQEPSLKLRSIVAGQSFTRSQKHLPSVFVTGSIRLIVAANNTRALPLGDENMAGDDLTAIASRFLLLKVGDKAQKWLAARNQGGKLTKSWVEGDLMARHILWLRDNRVVVPGKRFLVEGDLSEMHSKLLLQGPRSYQLVFEWVAKYMEDPKSMSKLLKETRKAELVFLGGGECWISTQAVLLGWDKYIDKDHRKLTVREVGRALAKLSSESKQAQLPGNRHRYHKMDCDLVMSWAGMNSFGDEYKMMQNLNAPRENKIFKKGTDGADQ